MFVTIYARSFLYYWTPIVYKFAKNQRRKGIAPFLYSNLDHNYQSILKNSIQILIPILTYKRIFDPITILIYKRIFDPITILIYKRIFDPITILKKILTIIVRGPSYSQIGIHYLLTFKIDPNRTLRSLWRCLKQK